MTGTPPAGVPVVAEVPVALDGERVDRAVATICSVSRRDAAEAVAAGGVRLDGEVVGTRARRVAAGQQLSVELEVREALHPLADGAVVVEVVYEDDWIAVVDKPAGLVVHPGAGHQSGTLVNGLLARYPEVAVVGDVDRPGIVHRLDVGTSGLLVVARRRDAYESLVSQLRQRSVTRRYRALVWGHVDSGAGLVDAPIGRSGRDRTRMAVSTEGRVARTSYEVLARYEHPRPTTLLECGLETGRTHQVRVHLAAIGHPVVGDGRYGGARPGIDIERPFLHAHELALDHPGTGERMAWSSPLPPELEALCVVLAP